MHKLNAQCGEDCTVWSLRFEAPLESKDLLAAVNSNPLASVSLAKLDAETKIKLLKANSLLVEALGNCALRIVDEDKKNPFAIYETSQERYATRNTATRAQLQTELYQKSFSSSQTMSKYIHELEFIFRQLEIMENTVGESIQAEAMFASFGSTSESSYGAVTTALTTVDDKELTWDKPIEQNLQEHNSVRYSTFPNGSNWKKAQIEK